MPLNKLFREDHQEADRLQELYVLELREQLVVVREDLELYENAIWEKLDAKFAEAHDRHLRDMMIGDPDQMILARERARAVSEIRSAPIKLREKIADLQKQLREVEGEIDG